MERDLNNVGHLSTQNTSDQEGKLGKLFIMKNGQTILQVGNILYNVSQGMLGDYQQTISCINVDGAKLYSLGGVNQKYVCTPNVDNLLR